MDYHIAWQKFLRLKVFADFVGQSKAVKKNFSPTKFEVRNRCKQARHAWLEALP